MRKKIICIVCFVLALITPTISIVKDIQFD